MNKERKPNFVERLLMTSSNDEVAIDKEYFDLDKNTIYY